VVAFIGFSVCVLFIGLVSCAPRPEEEASPTAGFGSEEGDIFTGGDSDAATPGPPGPVGTIDLETVRQEVREAGGGFWSVLQAPGAAGAQTYEVDAREDFMGAFTIGNYEEEALSLVFSCIVDFAQTPCVEDQTERIHRLELAAQEDATLQLRLSDLSEGLHDVIFAMFLFPDEHSTDPMFRLDSRFMYDYRRITVHVGASRTSPSLALVAFDEPDEMAGQGMHFYTLSRHGGDRWEESWQLEEEASPGESLEYYITRNNPEERAITYAFLAFLDYEQVPISGDHMVLYAQVGSQRRAMPRGEVIAPSELGEHEFFVLVADNPYVDQLEQYTSSDPLWANSYTSDRVLIRVQ